MTKPTKWPGGTVKTWISLGIRPVWSESSLSAWRKFGFLATHKAHSKGSDQTGWMPRLIWVFAGHMLFCWFCHAAVQLFFSMITLMLKCALKVMILKIWTELCKQCAPRLIRVYIVCHSVCRPRSWRSHLIRVYIVCHSVCRPRSWRSHLIRVYNVCHSVCIFWKH